MARLPSPGRPGGRPRPAPGRSGRGRPGRPAGTGPPARWRRGFQPGAPSASNGIVPTSSQRTRSPWNTGPSTQERTIRVTPSSPTTGSTHVMQTPIPQAMDSSTRASTGMS